MPKRRKDSKTKKRKKPLIILGSDHGGFRLKEAVKKALFDKEFFIMDFSPEKVPGDDYPDYAKKVCEEVKRKRNAFGLLFCRTGTGMVMAANKVKGIRAAFAHDGRVVKMARKDEDANVLCFPDTLRPRTAIKFAQDFINTSPSKASRHKRRIKKIKNLERL